MTHPSQEAQKLADDIANCIECIEQNSIVGGPIKDTIWFSDAGTLVDELHRIMERLRTPPVNQQPDTAALLNLLADIRQACGDNGKRMQDELVEHIRAGFAELALLRSQQPVSGGEDWLEEQDFYEAMQGYRCAPRKDQREVMAHFEHVKRFIRAHLSAPQAVWPAVAWRWRPSDVFSDFVLSDDPQKVEAARSFGRQVDALGVIPDPPTQQ